MLYEHGNISYTAEHHEVWAWNIASNAPVWDHHMSDR